MGIAATDINDAVYHRGRGLEPNLVVNQRVFAAVKFPFLFPGRRLDRVKITVPASDKEHAVRVGGRSMNHVAGLEFPFQLAGRCVQGVQVSVAAAEVNGALDYDRARKKHVELVGDRLRLRLKSVNSLCLKAPLAFRRELPFNRPGLRVQRIEFPVVAAGVNEPVRDGRRARRRPASGPFPNLPARFRIDRVDVAVVPAEIDDLVVPDRRRNDSIARREFPFHPMELARRGFFRRSQVRRIPAEHRLRAGR